MTNSINKELRPVKPLDNGTKLLHTVFDEHTDAERPERILRDCDGYDFIVETTGHLMAMNDDHLLAAEIQRIGEIGFQAKQAGAKAATLSDFIAACDSAKRFALDAIELKSITRPWENPRPVPPAGLELLQKLLICKLDVNYRQYIVDFISLANTLTAYLNPPADGGKEPEWTYVQSSGISTKSVAIALALRNGAIKRVEKWSGYLKSNLLPGLLNRADPLPSKLYESFAPGLHRSVPIPFWHIPEDGGGQQNEKGSAQNPQ